MLYRLEWVIDNKTEQGGECIGDENDKVRCGDRIRNELIEKWHRLCTK